MSWWCFGNGERSHLTNKILKCNTFLIDEMYQRLYRKTLRKEYVIFLLTNFRESLPCCHGKFYVPCRQTSGLKSHQIRRILTQDRNFNQYFCVQHASQTTGAIQFAHLAVQTEGVCSCGWGSSVSGLSMERRRLHMFILKIVVSVGS